MTIEGADLIYLAEGFAEQVADGDLDAALIWAQSAYEVLTALTEIPQRCSSKFPTPELCGA